MRLSEVDNYMNREIIKISNKKIVNGCEFAGLLEVSRQAIYGRATRGALVRRPDGLFDLMNPVNQDYIRYRLEHIARLNSQTRFNGEPATVVGRKNNAVKIEIEKKIKELAQNNESVQSDVESGGVNINEPQTNASDIDRAEAERQKTLQYVEKLRIENQKNRNKLVDKRLVSNVFDKLYSIDVNGFRTLAPRVASKIAAIAGLEDAAKILSVEETINSEVFQILKHVKLTINNFLVEIKDNFDQKQCE